FERVFGVKIRFRRMMEDLDTVAKLTGFLDGEMPADKFAPPPVAQAAPSAATAAATTAATAVPGTAQPVPAQSLSPVQPLAPAQAFGPAGMVQGGSAVHQLIQQQMQLMSQQLALLSGQAPQLALAPVAAAAQPVQSAAAAQPLQAASPAQTAAAVPAASAAEATAPGSRALVDKPFGASARIVLDKQQNFSPAQQRWIDDFIQRYNQRTGRSKTFSQTQRKVMSDPRVVTGFNPLWKDLVYPIVADRSKGARVWDIDGNEYI